LFGLIRIKIEGSVEGGKVEVAGFGHPEKLIEVGSLLLVKL